MQISPQTAFDNLEKLEQTDIVRSALYRQLAQEVLADTKVSLRWRQAIADRLNTANNFLAMQTVGNMDDSY